MLKAEFDVSYSLGHISRLLDKIGWTQQKPQEQASQRDDAEVEEWRTERWSKLKKTRPRRPHHRLRRRSRPPSAYVLPSAVRTYAPQGETPVLRYPYWEHLSVVSAITPEGKLYTMKQDESFDGHDIAILRSTCALIRCPSNSRYQHNRKGCVKVVGKGKSIEYAPGENTDSRLFGQRTIVWYYINQQDVEPV